MSNIFETLATDVGNGLLKSTGIPVTLSSTGQAINVTQPVQASQITTSGFQASGSAGTTLVSTMQQSAPLSTSPVAKDVKNIGRWGLGFVGFLAVLMFLKPAEAAGISAIVVLGALLFNAESAQKAGKPTVIQTIFGG